MTLNEAKEKQAILRKQQIKLHKEIDDLRQFIIAEGGNPDPPGIDFPKRNRAIYKLHLQGYNYSQIALQYNLSAARIRGICKRIDSIIEKKREGFNYYLIKV